MVLLRKSNDKMQIVPKIFSETMQVLMAISPGRAVFFFLVSLCVILMDDKTHLQHVTDDAISHSRLHASEALELVLARVSRMKRMKPFKFSITGVKRYLQKAEVEFAKRLKMEIKLNQVMRIILIKMSSWVSIC